MGLLCHVTMIWINVHALLRDYDEQNIFKPISALTDKPTYKRLTKRDKPRAYLPDFMGGFRSLCETVQGRAFLFLLILFNLAFSARKFFFACPIFFLVYIYNAKKIKKIIIYTDVPIISCFCLC